MKLKIALAFAFGSVLVAGLAPVQALAQRPVASVHQHGSSFHDRSPRIHIHESQPHH